MEAQTRKNPWLGLESYKEGEILYGRDDDIRDLTQCVLNDIDTLLYGKSGIGKSSILNAGILPAARRHGFLPVVIRLSHKEGHTYLEQIREGIIHAMLPLPTDGAGIPVNLSEEAAARRQETIAQRIREVIPCKDPANESLYEYFHRHTFHDADGGRLKLLIIFDQFEEIFTLQEDASRKKGFFTNLADLLNDIMPNELQHKVAMSSGPQEEVRVENNIGFEDLFNDLNLADENDLPEYVTDNEIHFVFTIREDFLSEFEYYTASIPSLKQNRYGLRPINEEQAAQIILRPVPDLIDESVARLIIENITGKKDFKLDGIPEIEVDSAVLSLYLNRLYEAKSGRKITRELVERKGGEIISEFYEDALSAISEHSVEYLEDALLNGQGRRDNITVYDAINDGKVTERELEILCNQKKILRQFNYAGDLRIEYVHDILCPVVKEHKEERALQKLQEEERRKQEEQQKRLLQQEENKRREIERKAAEEKRRLKEEAEAIRRKNRKRVATILLSIGIVALIVFSIWLKDYNRNQRLHEAYYARFEQIDGWPVGIGEPLTESERQHLPLYYRLSHRGKLNGGRHTDVEILSSNRFLPNSCRLPALEWAQTEEGDSKAREFNDMLRRVVRVRYSATGSSNEINREELLDRQGELLMTISYFHLSANDAWAQFYTAKGEYMKIRDNGLDRIKLSWDPTGRIKSLMYYDAEGIAQDIAEPNDIRGYIWEYVNDTTTVRYALNEFGLPTKGIANNTLVTIRHGEATENVHLTSSKVGDRFAKEVLNEEGYSRSVESRDTIRLFRPGSREACVTRLITRDAAGNIVGIRTLGEQEVYPPVVRYEYAQGLVRRKELLQQDGNPYVNAPQRLYKWEYGYDDEGRIVEETRTDISGAPTYRYKLEKRCEKGDSITRLETMDVTRTPSYTLQIDTVRSSSASTTYYGADSRPQNKAVTIGGNTFCVHRITTRREGAFVTQEFYASQGRSVHPLPTQKIANYKIVSCYRRIVEYDSNGNIVSLRLEDPEGNILKSMMYFIQNGQTIGHAVKGIDGTPVRCDKWDEDGYLYYKFYYTKDFEDQYSGLTAVDEWEHRSSTYDPLSGKYRYLKWIHFKGKRVAVFNNDEDLIKRQNMVTATPIFKTYNQVTMAKDPEISNLAVPYIHVLSPRSRMYDNRNGVVDGDRIIAFEGWRLGQSTAAFEREWAKSSGKRTVEIEVLRPDSTTYTHKKLRLARDEKEDEYIEYHILQMAYPEERFLKDFLNTHNL